MAKDKMKVKVDNPWSWALFVAYIGALVYFIERNEGFWGNLLAFLQAAAWPAYVVYEALTRLNV
jgi:drug/metabolite transporter (DMT)-like permease